MIALRSSVCIEAPREEVRARLARLEDIRLWSEAIIDARCIEGRDHAHARLAVAPAAC